MSLAETPRANRLQIGLFGRRNSGKSALVNALTGQDVVLVSDVAGTTTDPVYKAMEIQGLGPITFVDTAGFDDTGSLGEQRVRKTEEAAAGIDIALMLFANDSMDLELAWMNRLKKTGTNVIPVISMVDRLPDGGKALAAAVREASGKRAVCVSSREHIGLDDLHEEIIRSMPEDYEAPSITGSLCSKGDVVLLVMPQDKQAPKGRLILPQVQTIRELLDKGCTVISCTTEGMSGALEKLTAPPKLIITDSQVFPEVSALKPSASLLTSFSVLFAAYKGDIAYFRDSVKQLEHLPANGRILIAEACTHRPIQEDIGRVKLPRLLRKRFGEGLSIDITSGRDFPKELSGYDFIIHCGSCMFNRRYVMSRVAAAKAQGVPMSNYGVTLAWLSGILDSVAFPSR